MLGRFLPSLFLATATVAVSLHRINTCSIPAKALDLKSPFTNPPLSSPPRLVALGVGWQNYTCNSSGNYSSNGAVADLFDISCLYGTAEFDKVQNDAYDIWQKCHTLSPSESNLEKEYRHEFKIFLVGFHYFVNETGTLRPKFDFTSAGPTKGNSDAYVVTTKAVDVPAPDSLDDVDWLELKALSGKFADEVFRVDTKGGQPPTHCNPGSVPIFIKYATKYWFKADSL